MYSHVAITKFFLDSAEVLDNLNLTNSSWIKVLSSFNKETTYNKVMWLEAKKPKKWLQIWIWKSYNGIIWMNYGIKICNCSLIQHSRQNDILKKLK